MISTGYYPHCPHWYNDIQKIKWTVLWWWYPLDIIQGKILHCHHWYNEIQKRTVSWYPSGEDTHTIKDNYTKIVQEVDVISKKLKRQCFVDVVCAKYTYVISAPRFPHVSKYWRNLSKHLGYKSTFPIEAIKKQ